MFEAAINAGEGHLPSSLSVLDLISTLYGEILTQNDRFVLSKAHASLTLYAVLGAIGKLPKDWPERFCKPNSGLLGHPERDLEWGIEATTGSLGHGFPMAVGLAYGMRLSGSTGRVFCLVGDSELEEGSCWEAAMLASRLKLGNLTLLIDNNRNSPNGIDGTPYQSDLGSKFSAFGWYVYKIDGHDPAAIARVCQYTGVKLPSCVIARTVKGKGVDFMEKDPAAWHHKTGPELVVYLKEPA